MRLRTLARPLVLSGSLLAASCRDPISAADVPADKILCLMANAFLADDALALFCHVASDEWKIVKPFLSAHRIAEARKGAAPCASAPASASSAASSASSAPVPAP